MFRLLRLSVVAVAALGACAVADAAPVADPALGVVFVGLHGKLAFEMALSGKFRSVESEWSAFEIDAQGVKHERAVRLRYERVEDFERCAAAAPTERYGNMPDTGGIVNLHGADELLVRGVCVIASPVATITAAYELQYENNVTGMANLTERGSGKLIKRFDYDDVWSMFGVERFVSEPDVPAYWLFRKDPVTDDELVRALGSSEIARNAAIFVLGERVHLGAKAHTLGVYARVTQDTGDRVADALIASGALSDVREKTRGLAWRAAAAMPGSRAKLAPLLIEALKTSVVDESAPSYQARATALSKSDTPRAKEEERALHRNLEREGWDVSNWPAIKAPEMAGRANPFVMTATGAAASLFGQDVAELALNEMWDRLSTMTGGSWIDDQGYFLVVAAAGARGEELTRILIAKALRDDQGESDYALRMVLSMRNPSRELRNAVQQMCARVEGTLSLVKCDVLRIRDGQTALFTKLQSEVSSNWEVRTYGGKGWISPSESAFALLGDLAPQGLPYLREAALSSNRADATAALVALCFLGPGAGPGILQRAEAMMAERPTDQLKEVVSSCRLKGRTWYAWFIGL